MVMSRHLSSANLFKHLMNIKNMKIISTTLLLIVAVTFISAQDVRYEVRKAYSRPVTEEALMSAKSWSDISPGYPSSWITEYVSTEVTGSSNGKVINAKGNNETLSDEQLMLLQTADTGTDLIVDINYKYTNPITGNLDPRIIHFVLTVDPCVDAQYPGGNAELSKYLDQHAINKIPEELSKTMQSVLIRFMITETGKIVNAQLSGSSSNPDVDKLLIKAIKNMPKWKPAENINGEKVKQLFEFEVGNGC